MSSEQWREAIALSRAGKKTEARILLKQIVASDPQNETAWLWFADSFSKISSKIKAIELWMRIDPNSETARRALSRVRQFLDEGNSQQPQPGRHYLEDTRQTLAPKPKQKENAARNRAIVIDFGAILLIVLFLSAFVLTTRKFGYDLFPQILTFESDCTCVEVEGYLNRVLDRVERWKTNRALFEFASMLGDAPSNLAFAQQLYEEELNDTVPQCMDEAHITFLALLDLHLKYGEALQAGDEYKASYYGVSLEYKQGELQQVFAEIKQDYACDP